MRQQTLAELGIEALPPARVRPDTDPQVEMQLKDLRREVEVLRAEVEKLRSMSPLNMSPLREGGLSPTPKK
jgi:hypothetical protein